MKDFIYPSQLEEQYGGTAPNATCYWPPILPEMVELNGREDEQVESISSVTIIPRKDYKEFYNKHQSLARMPRELRSSLLFDDEIKSDMERK